MRTIEFVDNQAYEFYIGWTATRDMRINLEKQLTKMRLAFLLKQVEGKIVLGDYIDYLNLSDYVISDEAKAAVSAIAVARKRNRHRATGRARRVANARR